MSIHSNSRSWSFILAKMTQAGPWKQVFRVSSDLAIMGIDTVSILWGRMGDNGCDIAFWLDCWLNETPLWLKYSTLFALEWS
ncbi:hypothetical protein HanIR_Chr14g0675911 [Helianthus annuus]|nr:hypothetical protein HanIR_Chr14g0675911 [Helianthus annuus]